MVDKGKSEGETIQIIDWARPLAFQDSYEKMDHTTQIAAATYLPGGTFLEFNIIVPQGHFVRLADC